MSASPIARATPPQLAPLLATAPRERVGACFDRSDYEPRLFEHRCEMEAWLSEFGVDTSARHALRP